MSTPTCNILSVNLKVLCKHKIGLGNMAISNEEMNMAVQ